MLNKLSNLVTKKTTDYSNNSLSYIFGIGEAIWGERSFSRLADNAYVKNVVAHRCVDLVAKNAASVGFNLYSMRGGDKHEITEHPLIRLLARPNPQQGGAEFFEKLYAYKLLAGNAYIQQVLPNMGLARELHLLRPDRVNIITSPNGEPAFYRYTSGSKFTDFPRDPINGHSDVLHLKTFHPTNDLYGLSAAEAGAYSIEIHNQASIWNKSMLQNGARPSGAVMLKGDGKLTPTQHDRLRDEIERAFTGSTNAGRPFLLEGGMSWQEMSLTPKDMDFIESKNSSARDIALAFGVPPQLLGIRGDNTYSNMQEARLALWEETILPMIDHVCDALNHWLVPRFGKDLRLAYDPDSISALSVRREVMWQRLNNCYFLTNNEKRQLLGFSPLAEKGGEPPG